MKPKSKHQRQLLNKRFGMLTIIEYMGVVDHQSKWLCKCDCGETKIYKTADLTRSRGGRQSCGCLHTTGNKLQGLEGLKFSHLEVIKFIGTDKRKHTLWLCRCDCNKECVVRGGDLNSGHVRSCGCYNGSRIIPVIYNCPDCGASLSSTATTPAVRCRKCTYLHLKATHAEVIAAWRNIEWDLSIERVKELMQDMCMYSDEGNCVLDRYGFVGLDRLDNTKGYTYSNSFPCCKKHNVDKCSMTLSMMETALSKRDKTKHKQVTNLSTIGEVVMIE